MLSFSVVTSDPRAITLVWEVVSSHHMYRTFLSLAGTAVVTATDQAAWTDGRYHLQAEDELDCNWWLMRQGQDSTSITCSLQPVT